MADAFAGERSPAMVRNADGVGDVKPQWVSGHLGAAWGWGLLFDPPSEHLPACPACPACTGLPSVLGSSLTATGLE